VDRIKEMLDKLSELTEEQLTELQSAIVSEFETVEGEEPSPQTVDAMTSLADMLDTVRSEVARREAELSELAARAAEAAARVRGNADNTEQAANQPEEEPAKAEGEAEVPAEEEKAEEKKEEAATTEASTETEKAAELSSEQPEQPATAEPVVEAAAATEAAADENTVKADSAEELKAKEAKEEEEKKEKSEASNEVAELATAATAEAVAEPAKEAEAAATSNETVEETAVETQEATTVTAAVTESESLEVQAPADRRPTDRTTEAAPVAITAGADIPGYTAGAPMTNMTDVADAFVKRLHGLRRVNGGDGEQHIVASLATSYPEDRQLTQDAEANWNKIQAVAGPEALVASGGHAAPFEVRYDIFGFGTTGRPVRDSLPKFQADRGGIRFITPPTLSGAANAVGTWTNATDTTPAGATKASLTVTAAGENTVATDAITMQMQFGNLMSRAYPELVARHNELGLIQHSRIAEQYLLDKIDAGSVAVTSTNVIGVARDFLVQIGRAAAGYRSRHRLEADAPLAAIVPAWVRDAIIADLALNMPGDGNLGATYSEIEGYLASRNVNITFTTDAGVFGAQSAGGMVEFPDTFTWRLFAEGTFLFLDGGTLDLGIIRDSTLVGTNDYKMFVETFEGIAKVGIESLAVTSTISVNGAAAALRDTLGGVAASTVEL